MGKYFPLFCFVFILIGFFVLLPHKAYGAALVNLSDQLSTSRPSPAAPLDFDITAASTSAIIKDNGSYFLASDSAKFQNDTGETFDSQNVASMSALNIPVNNDKTVYLTGTVGHTHHKGDAVYVPITAVHDIQFTTATAVPALGKVVITFPGAGINVASPSATTFSFNGLASGNIYVYDVTGAGTFSGCASWTISAPSITCNLNASGIAAGRTLIFYLGCTAGNANACTASVPTLINPTASANQVSGNTSTADTWKVTLKTQDSGSIDIDSASTRIATIQSVQVQAQVDPTITFTIAGVNDGTTLNATSCNSDVTNTGVGTTSLFVNMGILANGAINKAAQTLTVSTNSANGYAITATSSGHLINPATGFYLQDNGGNTGLTANNTPVPAVFPASGNTYFGIHPCGTDALAVNSDQWVSASGLAFSAGGKVANPWNSGAGSYSDTVATFSGGPANARATTVEYGATVGGTTPAGIYTTVLTYIATATF